MDCERPLLGATCDPARYKACIYPPDFNTDLDYCTCEAPFGESFWNCPETHGTVCPEVPPVSGQACPSIPAGLWCHYYMAGTDFARGCQCDGLHVWQCSE